MGKSSKVCSKIKAKEEREIALTNVADFTMDTIVFVKVFYRQGEALATKG